MWIRTCQECGSNQQAKAPIYGETPTDSYNYSKCRKCKSESLDYGSEHKEDCTVREGKWKDKCLCIVDKDEE